MTTMILVLLASMGVPLLLFVAALLLIRWLRRRENRRSPLRDKIFHQAGEQLRQRIVNIDLDIDEKATRLLIIGPTLLLALLLPRVDFSQFRFGWAELFVLVAVLAFIGWTIRGLLRDYEHRTKAREGLAAEMATAQYLGPLMADGCLVFNDIPADKFNLDHVVIGPHAVFMVETKSRKKRNDAGKDAAQMHYDGSRLRFPDHTTDKPIEQARHQARWLSDYLRGAAGEAVRVVPVVALPGWYVNYAKDAQRSDVQVINPKMRGLFTDKRFGAAISDSLRNRIAHALVLRYPEIIQ